jgi:hypothetical protein
MLCSWGQGAITCSLAKRVQRAQRPASGTVFKEGAHSQWVAAALQKVHARKGGVPRLCLGVKAQ